ncbi:DUF4189 domain-containing protein [Sebaldella sp. S0638]|uniref:DUF4189 domain-containing protein n=1 Tax=Sebaldella sp. S0638 TaxID=2957809 RepID=UPI0020A12E06|nr:DUF4189 domain-containing protein [Sebaldella sp. S0638]MCP1226247.1 DUF4189 domain-containing protein [Sebaldella sp. S0638]
MKKLLLFITMLFALTFICSANTIPLEQCAGGSYQPVGQYPTYNNYGGGSTYYIYKEFAYDKNTGTCGSGKNVKRSSAKKTALTNCGTTFSGEGFVITSSNGIVLSIKTRSLEYTKYKENIAKSLEKCRDKGGTNCKVIYDTKNFHYDATKDYPDRGW